MSKEALAKELGAKPPKGLEALTNAELKRLAELVGDARVYHEEAIQLAEDNVVKMAPRPLRGTVRRILGGSK